MGPFLYGSVQSMQDIKSRVRAFAKSGSPVLIEGGPGTGKQALAEYIASRWGSGDLVHINCRFPEQLGELNGGRSSFFLKHLNLLSPETQERLQSLLYARGNARFSSPPPWILASSTESLKAMVDQGTFAADLNAIFSSNRITLPPLSRRAADIPAIFRSQVTAVLVGTAANGDSGLELSSKLRIALTYYAWPGNFRELEGVARSFALSPDQERLIQELDRRTEALRLAADPVREELSLRDQVGRAAKELESDIILRELERHRWNRRRTALTLKISYRCLLYKMKDLNVKSRLGEGLD